MGYYDIYNLRLNRYGNDYLSRMQNKREKEFDQYLNKTVFKVGFSYNGEDQIGSFERYKQNDTQSLHYLLTNVHLNIPNGTILQIPDKDKVEKPWMVYWLENIEASEISQRKTDSV